LALEEWRLVGGLLLVVGWQKEEETKNHGTKENNNWLAIHFAMKLEMTQSAVEEEAFYLLLLLLLLFNNH
jgi:hypothetical protein